MSVSITLSDNLAREAAKVGLTPAAIEQLLQAEIERRRKDKMALEEPRDWSQVSNRELLEQLNAAYDAEPNEEEKVYQEHLRNHHRRMMERLNDEW